MRKRNGFVFMETIVVVSVLSITLLVLFTSYSYILRKARERNAYDTTEMIYKTYFIKDAINQVVLPGSYGSSIAAYFAKNEECKNVYSGGDARVCDYSSSGYSGIMTQVKLVMDVEKMYYLNPKSVLSNDDYLFSFDATTIDYINKLGKSVDRKLIVVKFKKCYDASVTDMSKCEDYEIIHSSMEV